MNSLADSIQDKIFGLSMIVAPLLLAASSVVGWAGNGPHQDRLGGTIQVYALFLFIFVVLGLTRLLWQRAPRLAAIARVVGIFGCVGGINYGMDSIYGHVVQQAGASEAVLAALAEASNTGLPLVLNLPGVLFTLTMLVLGIALWRNGVGPAWVGLMLALAAVLFPASRIPDIQALYHLADGLFVISLGWLGLRYLVAPTPEAMASPAA